MVRKRVICLTAALVIYGTFAEEQVHMETSYKHRYGVRFEPTTCSFAAQYSTLLLHNL